MHKPLHFLVAPDSFKGSLSASQFCTIAEREIKNQLPDAEVYSYPLSDGGEGFVDCFIDTGAAEARSLWVSGPLGKKTKAYFAWQPEKQTAIIEMAQASGLTKISKEDLNPLNTHTYGTGQIIQEAIQLGAKKIILGVGGSATNDGGAGALMALGVKLKNFKGQDINLGGQALKQLHHIDEVPPHLLEIDWQIACDVTNPLLGEDGATAVFGPQKGGRPQQLDLLEEAMKNYSQIICEHANKDIHSVPGAGAAGGMAAGFMAVLNAKLTPGFDLIEDTFQLDQLMKQKPFDYIFTGEGRFDNQTRFGKLPLRVAQLGNKYDIPTIGLCGSLLCPVEELPEFKSIFSIVNRIMDENEAMMNAPHFLSQTFKTLIPLLK
jgi:glycerate kinase